MDLPEEIPLDELPVFVVQIMEAESSGESARKPEAKASPLQIEYMVNYLYQHPHIVVRKFRKLKNYKNSNASWNDLASRLNSMWSRTVINDVKAWKAIWRQEQSKALLKLEKKMETNQAATGSPKVELTLQDRKILNLLDLSSGEENLESAAALRGELMEAGELNTQQQEDIPKIDLTGCTSDNCDDSNSIGSDIFETLELLAQNIDDAQLAMMITDPMPALGTDEPTLEFNLPDLLHEPCTSNQQIPSFPTPTFDYFASFDQCPWSNKDPLCVPADVEMLALPEPYQTPSCDIPFHTVPSSVEAPAALNESCPPSQQNPSLPAPNVAAIAPPARWRPRTTYQSSCVPAEVEMPALPEPYQTPSCDRPFHTVPSSVEASAALNESCPPSQQNPPLPAPNVAAIAPPARWQPRTTYQSSCVPAEVEMPALPEPYETPSCDRPFHTVPSSVEAPAALNESCPPSQQNPPLPASNVAAHAPPARWRPWSTDASSCVPAEVETPASPERYQSPSYEKRSHSLPLPVETPARPAPLDKPLLPSQQDPSFLAPSVRALSAPASWQPWSPSPSSCVAAAVAIPALREPRETPSCEKPSTTVPEQVKPPVSREVSHSSNGGQQSSVQPQSLTRITKNNDCDCNTRFLRSMSRKKRMFDLAFHSQCGKDQHQDCCCDICRKHLHMLRRGK